MSILETGDLCQIFDKKTTAINSFYNSCMRSTPTMTFVKCLKCFTEKLNFCTMVTSQLKNNSTATYQHYTYFL